MKLVAVPNLGAIRDAVQELYGSSLKKIGRPEFYKPYPKMIDRENLTQGGIGSLISPCSLEKMANPP